MSLGGRITVTKAVLAAIPLYSLSYLPLPKMVEKQIRAIQSSFLWGADAESKKVAWIKWDDLCCSTKEGGVGIRNMGAFNKALLGKWIWRFLKEKDRLWSKVIRSRFGDLIWNRGGVARNTGRGKRTGWWKKIVDGIEGQEGSWFWERMSQELGEGRDADFWDGIWSGEKSVKELFPRLFYLSTNRNGRVKEMGRWEEGKWVWEITWRRELMDREKEKESELFDFLNGFNIMEGVSDVWKWGNGAKAEFTVKEAYEAIVGSSGVRTRADGRNKYLAKAWKTVAPYKFQVMNWRLLRDRLPTRDNLRKRRLLGVDEAICCCCHNAVENARHLFLDCLKVRDLWYNLANWCGSRSWVPPREIGDHFLCFANLLGNRKYESRLGGLWECAAWVLWRWRNMVIHERKEWDFRRLEDEIKCRFWSWCFVKGIVERNLNFTDWCRRSLVDTLA